MERETGFEPATSSLGSWLSNGRAKPSPTRHSQFRLVSIDICTGRGSCNKRDLSINVECRLNRLGVWYTGRSGARRGHFLANCHSLTGVAPLAPIIPVEAAILDGLGQMLGRYGLGMVEICDSAQDFQNPIVSARGKAMRRTAISRIRTGRHCEDAQSCAPRSHHGSLLQNQK